MWPGKEVNCLFINSKSFFKVKILFKKIAVIEDCLSISYFEINNPLINSLDKGLKLILTFTFSTVPSCSSRSA